MVLRPVLGVQVRAEVIIHTCDPFRTTNYPNREVVGLWEEAGGFDLRTFLK